MITQKYINNLAYNIVGCAIEVHKNLGPGLLESIYEACLEEEFKNKNFTYLRQPQINIKYKDTNIDAGLRLDFLVEDLIIVELKTVEKLLPVHKAQLLSYLKLTGKPKGLLINFNCDVITKNLVPMVTDKFSALPVY